MNILKRIRREYGARCGGTGATRFQQDLFSMLNHGYVLHTPEACLMGFRCHAAAIQRAMDLDHTVTAREHSDASGDCWFVWFAMGDIRCILALTPFPLKSVAFARRGRLKIYPLEKVMDFFSAMR